MLLLLTGVLAIAAPAAPVAEGEVRGVVDHWLAAQNAGDFAAYEELFAARFTGLRRSGFNADLWALYEEREGKLIPRNTPGKTSVKPVAVTDSDGDGNSELLCDPGPFSLGAEKARVLLDGELWDKHEEIGFSFMDCPC